MIRGGSDKNPAITEMDKDLNYLSDIYLVSGSSSELERNQEAPGSRTIPTFLIYPEAFLILSMEKSGLVDLKDLPALPCVISASSSTGQGEKPTSGPWTYCSRKLCPRSGQFPAGS